MPKLGEILRIKNNRPNPLWISIPQLAAMIQTAYEWEEFSDLDENKVTNWIADHYGWTAMFTPEQADSIIKELYNSGWNFND